MAVLVVTLLVVTVLALGCGSEDYTAQDAEATVESRLGGTATEVNCIPEGDEWVCDVTLDIAGSAIHQDIRIDEADIEAEGAA